VRLWDPATGSAVGAPLTHNGWVTSLAALKLPDGRCLLASGSGDLTIRLWDPTTGSAVGAPLTGHTYAVRSLAVLSLADGRCLLASGSRDKTIRVWNPATGSAVGAPLSGHAGAVSSLAAFPLPDGRCLLASASDDDILRLWDVFDSRTLHLWRMRYPISSLGLGVQQVDCCRRCRPRSNRNGMNTTSVPTFRPPHQWSRLPNCPVGGALGGRRLRHSRT